MPNVIQEWAQALTFMQQSVLVSSVRGPDGLHKDHIAKYILRWLRRCFLISSFEGRALLDPINGRGGSFTGGLKHPDSHKDGVVRRLWCQYGSMHHESEHRCDGRPGRPEDDPRYWEFVLDGCAQEYLRAVDEVPHHFHLHLMHAAEILGYKHPEEWIRVWWHKFYHQLVHDAHMHPESMEEMDRRLGDDEEQWREREVVSAAGVPRS